MYVVNVQKGKMEIIQNISQNSDLKGFMAETEFELSSKLKRIKEETNRLKVAINSVFEYFTFTKQKAKTCRCNEWIQAGRF